MYSRWLIKCQNVFAAHQREVTGCVYASQNEVLVASGKDKYITWHLTKNGQRLGGYQTAAVPNCLQ